MTKMHQILEGINAGRDVQQNINYSVTTFDWKPIFSVCLLLFIISVPNHTGKDNLKIKKIDMDTKEVSVSLYDQCIRATFCRKPQNILLQINKEQNSVFSPFCNYGKTGYENHPINCVTKSMAEDFCAWAGKRLPTEEEWDLAARGLEHRRYPWGGQIPDESRLNGCGLECAPIMSRELPMLRDIEPLYEASDGFLSTAPVDSFPNGKTPSGLMNMAGNVAEWTDTEKEFGQYIIRGGHWLSGAGDSAISTSGRGVRPVDAAMPTIGFRCARDLD